MAAAAKAAFPAWRDTPAPVRGRILFRVQALMDKEKDELARLLTREEGKTVKESMGEIQRTINILEYTAAEGRRIGGQHGAVGAAPQLLLHAAPAARRGGLHHALELPGGHPGLEDRARAGRRQHRRLQARHPHAGDGQRDRLAETASAVVSIFERAGVPKGVLNMVLGSGGTVGNALVDHDDVRAVSFTGSNEVGARTSTRAAPSA